jgi:tetratricopeptide (TPR) repeat protein
VTCFVPALVLLGLASPAPAEPPENSAAYWEEQAIRRNAVGDLLGVETALRRCRGAARSMPDRTMALANLVAFLLRYERAGEAGRLIPELETLASLTPEESPALAASLNVLGAFHQQTGQPAKALPWLRRAAAAPGPPEARPARLNNVAITLIDLGQAQEAVSLLESLAGEAGIAPGLVCLTHLNLAAAYVAAGRKESGRLSLERVLEEEAGVVLEPDEHARFHQLAALLLRQFGDRKRARSSEREAERLLLALDERSGGRHRIDVADLPRK